MNASLQGRVRSSVRVTMGATFASAFVQIATMVVLARLLGPVDYGFYVVALSINALSVQFLTSATERAMVIEPDAETLRGRAVPTMLMLSAVALLVFAGVAVVKALTGWQVQLGVLALVLGGQAIGGLGIVPRALLRREIRFVPIAASEFSGLLLGNFMTAAIFAWLGFGPYALGLGALGQYLVNCIWMLSLAPRGVFRPRFREWRGLPRILYGVMKPATLEAVNGQVSPLVVSSVLGPVPLGLFNRVYNITTLPVQLLVSSVSRVIISTLVSVADDPPRRRRATELMVRSGSAVVAPLAFGLAGSGGSFVAVVLGSKWMATTPIVPFLAVAVWGNMMGSLFGQLADAAQRFNSKARIQAISTGSLVAFLLVGGHWGLVGVAIGAMLAALLFVALYVGLTASIVESPVRSVVGWMLPGALAGAGCFAAARSVGWVLIHSVPALTLALQILACGIVMLVVLVALDRDMILTVSRLLLPGKLDRLANRILGRPAMG